MLWEFIIQGIAILKGNSDCNKIVTYRDKALELWHRAGEIGCTKSYCRVGMMMDEEYVSNRVEMIDEKKAKHYYELAAIGGCAMARTKLGTTELLKAGNFNRALKHYMIAVSFGSDDSLNAIQEMFEEGVVSKDDYTKALKSYQLYLDEIQSNQRNAAAAFSDEFKYY